MLSKKGFTPYIIFQRLRRLCVFSKKKRSGSCITGFTLIEVLVAVAIFSMLISVFAGFLVGSIRSQQKVLASQQLVDSVSYNLEYMSRALRMAKKDHTGNCLTTVGAKYNYETNASSDRIRFLNYDDKCQEFFLDGDVLKERKSADNTAVNFATALPLTSTALQVVSFKLGPSTSWGQAQKTQPRVTLSLKIQRSGEAGGTPLLMSIQTSISQRNLNRIY